MEKRLILAIALSIFIILSFQYLTPKPPLPPEKAKPAERSTAPCPVEEKTVIAPAKPDLDAEEQEIRVETDRYIVVFSNIGGAINGITLKDYKNLGSSEPLELVKIRNAADYIFSTTNSSYGKENNPVIYDGVVKDDCRVKYSATGKDFEIIKRYIFHKSKPVIELHMSIKNISKEPKELSYRIIGGAGLIESDEKDHRFLETTAKMDGKNVGYKRPKDGIIITPGLVSWTALKSKYFSVILKPFVNTRDRFYELQDGDSLTIGVDTENRTIHPGVMIEDKFLLYAGPSQTHILKTVGYDLEETINYGFFGGISKVLISAMRLFYRIINSWGIAIILLSIFLNIILFPLTVKSFKSMQKMQELHPQMEKLKVQFKDNPQKLNKEVMELYKKYNINPLSGCLPMLLQMPIFIALYQALMKSIELRGAKFLWIKDLSLPDAVPLPVSLPLIGNSINILPIVMVAAMVVQQRMSTQSMGSAVTAEQRQQQKMMLILMPVMFGFIFYSMPSGLVLYWVISTALTIFEQAMVLKKA